MAPGKRKLHFSIWIQCTKARQQNGVLPTNCSFSFKSFLKSSETLQSINIEHSSLPVIKNSRSFVSPYYEAFTFTATALPHNLIVLNWGAIHTFYSLRQKLDNTSYLLSYWKRLSDITRVLGKKVISTTEGIIRKLIRIKILL